MKSDKKWNNQPKKYSLRKPVAALVAVERENRYWFIIGWR